MSTSTTSFKSRHKASSNRSYVVREQKTQPTILRDPDATTKLLDYILESANGKRALSRLARTCRAMREPALNALWRELDSLVPILWQFPGHLLKKARKPGMGFVKTPTEEDWKNVLKYAERVRQITYNENANNVVASIFPILQESHPYTYVLPHLTELNWKAETSAGLDRCTMFLNPELRAINLDLGIKFPHLNAFLSDMSSRTKLTSFSFISPTSLPDTFTQLLLRQTALEQVVLVAPGALAPGVGRWVASLPKLKTLRLDLTGRSMIAVEGFFDELRPRSGDSTPTSVGSTDSGIYSDDEEVDFSMIRKSALRLTGDLRSKKSFAQMRKLHLTGEVSNTAVFIKHLTCPLTHLELVIEDPPDKADWHDLSALICDKFGDSLQSLKITATGSSRFVDLVRSTSRAEPASARLSFEYLTDLSCLTRLEVDLPESVIFINSDIETLAKACPNLEVLKLCPLARFPSAPKISLESLATLLINCRHLHTIAAVVDAKKGTLEVFKSRQVSSPSLLRLHVGHSWISDPLEVAVLLSHLAPRLELLKWFQEKNRPGFVEANARNWQKVAEFLPHLQNIRLLEQHLSVQIAQPVLPETIEKSVDAVVRTTERGIHALPEVTESSVQVSPVLLDQTVQAVSIYRSISTDATPEIVESGVDPIPSIPLKGTDAGESSVSKSVQALLTPSTFRKQAPRRRYPSLLIFPSIFGLLSFAYRLFILYPMSLPSRMLRSASAQIQWRVAEPVKPVNQVTSYTPSPGPEVMDIYLDTLEVRH